MLRHRVPATELTTLAVGGPVDTVIDVATDDRLLNALTEYPDARCIGGGSNLLISDSGYEGTIIRCFSPGRASLDVTGDRVRASATSDWDSLVSALVESGLQGLEATSGVPGSVGGAVVQNLGAYGQEIADVIVSVDAWDRKQHDLVTLDQQACDFAYRNSRFKHDDEHRYVVVRVDLHLRFATEALIRYGDVSNALGSPGAHPLSAIRSAVLDVRRSKGMVLGASAPSAGSFFVNPIIDSDQQALLEDRGLKTYVRSDGARLTSAAALIEAAGFHKGYTLGRAALSDLHVLAVTNRDNASTNEIVSLAQLVRERVSETFGITLDPEPVRLGFEVDPFA